MTLAIPPNMAPAHATHAPLSRTKRGVAAPDRLWPQHSVLTISLLNMTKEQKDVIKHNINKWAPHTNLYFKFTDRPNGDIRIVAKNDTDNAWSMIGTAAKKIPLSEPTMSIGFKRTPTDLAATIQHEFGHALGLRHEHQHPDRTLDLNKPNIHQEYESQGLFAYNADEEVIQTPPRIQVKASPYDQKSIMHYGFKASDLQSGPPIPRPTQISGEDEHFMQSLYPQDKSLLGRLLNTTIRAMVNT
ncbi:hypothetical protein C4J95_1271 [Pseudomonas orientalis]|uniref:M12 family metallopeptidase n=1 Tax=Pseudomonas orientalis TaxID=76758 RepID=UPI000F56D197|nr:M12 family metallopeptidase [Pseudomonas orientalis]AZE93397.1 hypothetical protein C4J96_1263 [Pseudomonas orientalis]AZE98749.1 hypothetical protein C4J95_1271 [Pseudomonas orientalis]